MDGYNVCIFAYGQTGSGKTFTIYGDDANPGLTPRAIAEVMRCVHRDSNKSSVKMECYMLELYRDDLIDLLLPVGTSDAPRLDIKKDKKGWITVPNATIVPVTSEDEIIEVIHTGLKVRKTAGTKMNVESSRSHLIFSLVMETTDLQTGALTKGKLSFVDLAGSERVKKSGAEGDTLKEAQAINKSLSALGDVISALASEQQHIPYRNHKLTMLMKMPNVGPDTTPEKMYSCLIVIVGAIFFALLLGQVTTLILVMAKSGAALRDQLVTMSTWASSRCASEISSRLLRPNFAQGFSHSTANT